MKAPGRCTARTMGRSARSSMAPMSTPTTHCPRSGRTRRRSWSPSTSSTTPTTCCSNPSVLGATPPAQPDPAYLMTSAGQEIETDRLQFRGQPFDSYYRTRWLHAGWPDRKKSWRRPTLVCRQVDRRYRPDRRNVSRLRRDDDSPHPHPPCPRRGCCLLAGSRVHHSRRRRLRLERTRQGRSVRSGCELVVTESWIATGAGRIDGSGTCRPDAGPGFPEHTTAEMGRRWHRR